MHNPYPQIETQPAVKSINRLKKLAELSLTLSGEPVEIFRKIAHMIGELLEVKIVCLSEIEDDSLHFLSVYNDGQVFIDAGQCLLVNTPCSTVQTAKDFRVYQDVANKFPKAVFLKEHNAFSYCGFPALDSDSNVIAVICLLDDKPHDFTEEDQDLLRIFGQRIGVELERKRRLAEKKKSEITLARREAELDAIFNSISDVVVFADTRRRIVSVNSAMEAVFGYTLEELQGKETKFIYADPEDFNEQGKIRYNADVRTQPQVYKMHYRRKDGTIFTGETLGTSVTDNQGKLLGFVGIIRDITDREKLEDKLHRLGKLESLGVLAGGIAHDFNNLLTAVVGNISLAKLFISPDDKAYPILTDAENASARAKDLTSQLLTFSKGGEPIRKIFHLSPVLKEASSFVLSGANVKCCFAIPDDLSPVEADPGQISQVINNLIINAVHSMPDGGTIDVTCRDVLLSTSDVLPLPEGRYVKVTVQDHGLGIPRDHLEKIFDPYFSTKQQGSGLGLATCHSIITRHGGHIEAEAGSRGGTAFHFYLPACTKKVVSHEIQDKNTIENGSGTILIMDDDKMVRHVAGRMLNRLGYEVTEARDGAEAVELYKKCLQAGTPFNAVIMDLTIPAGMGGRDAIKILKKLDPGVKAIVSSGYSNDPVMSKYKDYGFMDVVTKPYKIEELSVIVARVVSPDRKNCG
jgi:PAS domain S-box-containing protein